LKSACQKGTLRYFEVRFADISTFSKQLAPASEADGILLYCVPSSKAEAKELAELAAGSEVRELLAARRPRSRRWLAG
jgi:hypothetical protein